MRRTLKRLALKFLGIDWYRSVRRNYKEMMDWLEHGSEFIDIKK
jgi:hypothetical protein